MTSMRRHDRAKDDEWIAEFLTKAAFCTIATSVNDVPYASMNTFVYDSGTHSIYFHTAKSGHFRRNIDQNPRVCLMAGQMGRLLPAKVAREFSVEYGSVVVFGQCRMLDDMKLARDKMQLLNEKYFPHLKPGDDYRPITPTEIAEIAAYQLQIESWSGKAKHEADDFPGAFLFGHPPYK